MIKEIKQKIPAQPAKVVVRQVQVCDDCKVGKVEYTCKKCECELCFKCRRTTLDAESYQISICSRCKIIYEGYASEKRKAEEKYDEMLEEIEIRENEEFEQIKLKRLEKETKK